MLCVLRDRDDVQLVERQFIEPCRGKNLHVVAARRIQQKVLWYLKIGVTKNGAEFNLLQGFANDITWIKRDL